MLQVGARWFKHCSRRSHALPQGDVFAVAQLAGIQAAKQTAHLIPLCHSLSLRCVGGREAG